MNDNEVLIVGAGPVGLLAAVGLLQAGGSGTGVEAAAELNDSPRAAIYFAPSLIALRELGLLDDLDRLSLRVSRFGQRVPDYGYESVISAECMTGLTFDYQLHCGQDVLCRVALDHVRRLGGTVLFEHKLTGFEQDAEGVRATVETPHGERAIRAKWLIGADGARSTVRHLMDVEFEGFTWPNRFIATNVHCDFESLGYQKANFVCDPVYMAVIAILGPHGPWRVTYQEDGSLPVESFMDRLPERYAFYMPEGTPYEVVSASPYTLHQRCAATLRVGRVLLAGDAAHATNPCGGLGLTTGFWTAMILSDVLAAVMRGEEDESILDRYSDERRRIFWEVTSPAATRNKKMLEESDPEQRLKDIAEVERAVHDVNVARQFMSFPFKVIGDPLREGSRWTNADPTAEWGIDLKNRTSQLVD